MKILHSKFIFLIIFPLILLVLLSTFNYYKKQELNSFLELQTQEAKNRYNGITLFPQDTSNFIFNYLINTRKVINIFKYAVHANAFDKGMVRKRLYSHLEDVYKDLKTYNIQQLHFHLPNNESFLRFHRPNKFGDDLTNVRHTVAFVNKNLKIAKGFEEGRIFNGYRFVYPLFDEKNAHIGSVEISHSVYSFKQTYQRSFKNIYLDVVIDEKVVKDKIFIEESKNYTPSVINPNFLHLSSMVLSEKVQHASDSIKSRKDIKVKMKNYKSFSVAINHKNHKGLVSFIPIKNSITNENVAYAISFQRSDYLAFFYEEKNTQMISLVFVAFLITLVIYYILQYSKELKRKVYIDSLMEIYNRRFFETYLSESCKKQKRNNTELSLIMFDVDYFKNINDTHGHDVGDKALKFLAKLVQDYTRDSDIFARWGGEEFMLLVDIKLSSAHKVAENLRLAIMKYSKENQNIPEFTCSFGVVSLEGIKTIDEACKKVDAKLYKAKETGRNKVVV